MLLAVWATAMHSVLHNDNMDRIRPPAASAPRLLVPGRNCWRIERAHRAAVLIDGKDYFAALRAALVQAQHSVFILGWDIDSRMRLVPQGANDGYPEELGDFLNELVKERRRLRMYVLSWDWAMVFALDREWLPLYKLDWRTHRRLSFRLDDKHPLGASHHQKVVVIDDAVAFVGGLDLTHCRWDTPEHGCHNEWRCETNGKPYRPYHDVQALVDGPAARALGELCRERWQRATGNTPLVLRGMPAHDPWPPNVAPEIADVEVAISRTDPGYVTGQPVYEIRNLYVDAILAAKRTIYAENQFSSASAVASAFEARLREPDSPEIVMVSRRIEEGWLEQRTLGVLRARVHRRLKEADRNGRYRLYYPYIPGLELPNLLNVHSKLIAFDSDVLSVGSANFTNRSLGLDTECNLVFEARGDARIERFIERVRNRLLAEHLGTDPDTIGHTLAEHDGMLIPSIEALIRPGSRTLTALEPKVDPELEAAVPEAAMVDPERPVDAERLMEEFVPPEARKPVVARFWALAIGLLTLAVIAAAWRWTPLSDWLALETLARTVERVEASPVTPLIVLAAYVLAGVLVIPVVIMIILTALAFGPFMGALYAIGGTLLSAAVTYAIGRRLGRDTVRRLAGWRLNRITKRLGSKGILAIVAVRLLPMGPFSIVNAVAGSSRIGLREFLLGTAVGMFPGIVLTMLFVDRLAAAITDPGGGTFAALGLVTAGVIVAAIAIHRHFGWRDEVAR
jgi:phospholipase D1/2